MYEKIFGREDRTERRALRAAAGMRTGVESLKLRSCVALCRTCAPEAPGPSHDFSTPQQSTAPLLEKLCISSSSPSQSSHCPYLRASTVTVLYWEVHLPSHQSSQRKACLYAVPDYCDGCDGGFLSRGQLALTSTPLIPHTHSRGLLSA
jgi:hypothetical protein